VRAPVRTILLVATLALYAPKAVAKDTGTADDGEIRVQATAMLESLDEAVERIDKSLIAAEEKLLFEPDNRVEQSRVAGLKARKELFLAQRAELQALLDEIDEPAEADDTCEESENAGTGGDG